MTPHDHLVAHTLSEVARVSGLVFKDIRHTAALDVIAHWLVEHGIDSTAQIAPGDELDRLIEQIVVHESYFDRDLDQLRMIDELVFSHARGDLRVWSAGCAGGEEPYTLAFMLESRGLLAHTSFTATDISRLALARARAGSYRAWSLRTGDKTPAMRYLQREGGQLVVPESIKRAIDFRVLNLLEDDYPVHQNLVLCRNVLIYLAPDAIAKVAVKLAHALTSDGWLFVAPSDPRLDPYAALEATVTDRGVYYRRKERVVVAAARPPVVVRPPQPIVVKAAPAPLPPPKRVESLRANQLADRGDYEGARRMLAASLTASPLDAELHFLTAVLAADDDVAASLAALDRAIYLAPEVPASYLFSGRLHQSRGDITAARRAYRSALRILESLPPEALVPWADEPARLLASACRQALESLDAR